jgi:electron transport complex protein RnfC
LQPQELLIAARALHFESLDALGLMECIECGCCDVVCPSHIPLTEIFRRAKPPFRAHGQEAGLSAQSEPRHARRHERLRTEAKHARELQQQLKSGIEAAVDRARRKREHDTD